MWAATSPGVPDALQAAQAAEISEGLSDFLGSPRDFDWAYMEEVLAAGQHPMDFDFGFELEDPDAGHAQR